VGGQSWSATVTDDRRDKTCPQGRRKPGVHTTQAARAYASALPALRLSDQDLARLLRASFAGAGLPDRDASAVSEVLVDANLRGTESHGLARAPAYLRRVHAGVPRGTEAFEVSVGAGALCRVDAGQGLGPAVAVRAVDLTIELADEHGLGLVAVGGSSHFGAAGFYARRAAERGLISLVASNGPATMAPHGAARRFLGTNAIAVGAPLGRHGAFVLDMSSSIEARGKIIRANALGRPIASGLAIDPQGRPTTDAAAALAGAVLPLGGPKGSGLAFAVCLLAGVLGGACFDDEVAPMYGDPPAPQNVGHVFLVVDPWRLAAPDEAAARVEALVDRLHALPAADGHGAVRVAGERGDRLAAERRRDGIPVESAELEVLAAAREECGMPDLAARARALGAG
jgi:LDH2 family malate/lactate/ureidoglycolate dehydrogenase